MAAKEQETITVTKSELAKLVSEAVKDELKAKAKADETKQTEENAAGNAWLNELVEIKLFKDGREYSDDVSVQVNGKCWVIKRGYPVKVPRFVKLQYDNSQRQHLKSAEFQQSQQKEFKEATHRFNI